MWHPNPTPDAHSFHCYCGKAHQYLPGAYVIHLNNKRGFVIVLRYGRHYAWETIPLERVRDPEEGQVQRLFQGLITKIVNGVVDDFPHADSLPTRNGLLGRPPNWTRMPPEEKNTSRVNPLA